MSKKQAPAIVLSGAMVRFFRVRAGLSRTQLAALLFVSRTRIEQYERQKRLQPATSLRVILAIDEGERRRGQWVASYGEYLESADQDQPVDYVTQRIYRDRVHERERQRRYRARRKTSALELLQTIDRRLWVLLAQPPTPENRAVIVELRALRREQERILRQGGWIKDAPAYPRAPRSAVS